MVYVYKGDQDEGDLFSGKRTCQKCSTRKSITEFHWASHRKYRTRVCKECQYKRSLVVKAQQPPGERRTQARAYGLRSKYGLTPQNVWDMLEEQNWVCKICGRLLREDITHVDHSHKKGHVRGLLCENCNRGLGHFKDDPYVLFRARIYLLSDEQSVRTNAALAEAEKELAACVASYTGPTLPPILQSIQTARLEEEQRALDAMLCTTKTTLRSPASRMRQDHSA